MPAKISRADLLAELRRLADELGTVPTREQMNEHGEFSRGPYDREFGGWNQALQAAGLDVNKPVQLSREELLSELERLAAAIDRVPRQKDMNERGEYSTRAYKREWENWNAALRAAGFDPNKKHGEKVTLTCEFCGTEYKVKPSLKDSSRFCTDGCKDAYKADNWIGEKNPHPHAGERVTKTCEWCGDEYETYPHKEQTSRFCTNECKDAIKQTWTGEDHPRWNGGNLRYYGPNWRRQRRRRLEKDNYECQQCGISNEECRERYGQGLEIHHKTPIKQFGSEGEINYAGANKLDNLVALCRVCHQKSEERLKADT